MYLVETHLSLMLNDPLPELQGASRKANPKTQDKQEPRVLLLTLSCMYWNLWQNLDAAERGEGLC